MSDKIKSSEKDPALIETPNKARKYGDKAIIEPGRVIQERKQIGLHPSRPVPAGAILCYDTI